MNTIPFAHNNPVFRRVEELARKEHLSSDERREILTKQIPEA